MGKRKGEWLSFMALLLMFMLTTLFFYMVYTMHYDSAADDFTGFTVFDYQSEPGAQVRTKLGTLREDLDDWARRNQAVVFYKGFSSAGIAALDYAGWFQRTWHTPFDGREAKTALIQKENGNLYTYTEGDTLFPGTYNYHILGEFDGNRSPTFQGDAFFYYPLADITDLQGLLFTNVDSGESLSELTSIVEKTGRSIEYQTYTDSNLNILEVLKKMFMDDFVSRSLLFAFLGLVFCAVFAMSIHIHIPCHIPGNRDALLRFPVIFGIFPNAACHLIDTVADFLGVPPVAGFAPFISRMCNLRGPQVFQRAVQFLCDCRLLFPLFCRRLHDCKGFLLAVYAVLTQCLQCIRTLRNQGRYIHILTIYVVLQFELAAFR